jgi:hypothetical protein
MRRPFLYRKPPSTWSRRKDSMCPVFVLVLVLELDLHLPSALQWCTAYRMTPLFQYTDQKQTSTWLYQPRLSKQEYAEYASRTMTTSPACSPASSTPQTGQVTHENLPLVECACVMCLLAWWLSALITVQDNAVPALLTHVASMPVQHIIEAGRNSLPHRYDMQTCSNVI